MSTILKERVAKLPSRMPHVPERATPLSEAMRAHQIMAGLYIVERGVPLALPCDNIKTPNVFLGREFWRQSPKGAIYRVGARAKPRRFNFQRKALEWLRDHVDERVPYWYYLGTLGHDLHVSTFADLYGKHWHVGWANPFTRTATGPIEENAATSGLLGFVEHLGWLSGAKVTSAFVSQEVAYMSGTDTAEYADYDYHEVGLSNTAESNGDTALLNSSGIARVAGTPTNAAPIYRTVATITADTAETWEEHGVFNNSTGPYLLDRSLTGGQAVVASDQVMYTYELTKQAEA